MNINDVHPLVIMNDESMNDQCELSMDEWINDD